MRQQVSAIPFRHVGHLPDKVLTVHIYANNANRKFCTKYGISTSFVRTRLCGSPSIPLSFILANVLPRWNTYCVCDGTEELCSPTPSIHRLRRGLPGYLILFAPHAFEPQRQLPSSKPPSPLVFLLISTHFTATLGIPLTSPVLKINSFQCSPGVEPPPFTSDLLLRLRSLYTQ